jgi:hypothetical protein
VPPRTTIGVPPEKVLTYIVSIVTAFPVVKQYKPIGLQNIPVEVTFVKAVDPVTVKAVVPLLVSAVRKDVVYS